MTERKSSGWPKGRRRNNCPPPAGWDSVEQFLVDVDAYCRQRRLVTELARVLGVSLASAQRWLAREKLPTKPTLTVIARWYRGQRRREKT